jgi:hypothetical protein
VGTIVIDNPGSPNPDYPLGSFTITGDFIVRNGSFAAAWGGVSPTNMTCRDFIVEGATSEVRLRNANIDGTLTIQGDLVIRDGGVFRDAAGGLVVAQPVPVNIGGNLVVETGGSLANLGGVFDWVTTFNGSGGQLMSNNGGAGCAAETVVVAGGTTLEMADGPMSMDSLTASTLTVSAFTGGLLDGAHAHNENASFAGNGTATISDATVTLSTALNTSVGGLIVDSSVADWHVME